MAKEKKISFQWFYGTEDENQDFASAYMRINFIRKGTVFSFYSINHKYLKLTKSEFEDWENSGFSPSYFEEIPTEKTLLAYEELIREEYKKTGENYKLKGFSDRVRHYFSDIHTVLSNYLEISSAIIEATELESGQELTKLLAQTQAIGFITDLKLKAQFGFGLTLYSWKHRFDDSLINDAMDSVFQEFNHNSKAAERALNLYSKIYNVSKEDTTPKTSNSEMYFRIIAKVMKMKEQDVFSILMRTIREK